MCPSFREKGIQRDRETVGCSITIRDILSRI